MDGTGSLTVHGPAALAAAVGDPARGAVLTALMGGQALTAGELSRRAGVTAPATSGHLARLRTSALIVEARQGRHRYYALASPEVAGMLESLVVVAAGSAGAAAPVRTHPPCRTSYDSPWFRCVEIVRNEGVQPLYRSKVLHVFGRTEH